MTNKGDGGAAFPRTGVGNAGVQYDVPPQDGMSLRDWFAGMVLQGMEARACDFGSFSSQAAEAYDIADAMIAERAKRGAS